MRGGMFELMIASVIVSALICFVAVAILTANT